MCIYLANNNHHETNPNTHNNGSHPNGLFRKSISEIMITDFENGELTVRIRCSLTDSKQEVKTDLI